jgi:hypothetical protein
MDTGVFGGLVAGVVLAVGPYVHTHRKIDRHHRERMSIERSAPGNDGR